MSKRKHKQFNKIGKIIHTNDKKVIKEVKIIKKNQTEILQLWNPMNSMNENTIKNINIRINKQKKEYVSYKIETLKLPSQRSTKKKKKKDLWDIIKRTNAQIIGVLEQEREKGTRKIGEIIAKNLPNLGRNLDIQIHEANRPPYNFNTKKSPSRHCNETVKNQSQQRILKSAREKSVT